ncbi:hypothetical protein Acid7E03_42470 [Acidisoma sp. 7E03]
MVIEIPPLIEDASGKVKSPRIAASWVKCMAAEIAKPKNHCLLGARQTCRHCFAEHIGLAGDNAEPSELCGTAVGLEIQVLVKSADRPFAITIAPML